MNKIINALALAIGLIITPLSASASVFTNGSLHFELGACTDNPRSSITEVKWSDAKPIAGSDKRSITICVRASENIKQFGFTYSTPSFYGPGEKDIVVTSPSTIGYKTSDNVTIEFPQRGGWLLSIEGKSGKETGGVAPIEYDFTNVKATLIYDHRIEKTIKHVPDQLSADGLLRLLVFLDRPLSDEKYADTDFIEVTAKAMGSDSGGIKIVTDPSPMRFDNDNDYGVVIVSGDTDAAKREIASGNISVKLAGPKLKDYPTEGYIVNAATVNITKPAVAPLPLCSEAEAGEECIDVELRLSSFAGGARSDLFDGSHSVPFAPILRKGGGRDIAIEFTCHSENGCGAPSLTAGVKAGAAFVPWIKTLDDAKAPIYACSRSTSPRPDKQVGGEDALGYQPNIIPAKITGTETYKMAKDTSPGASPAFGCVFYADAPFSLRIMATRNNP